MVLLPIDGWKLSHFTRFARHVEKTYPVSEPQDRVIATPLEEFGGPPKPTTLVFESSVALWWYLDNEHGRLIQLQRDRFVHNWRKIALTDRYPGYAGTREQFRLAWLGFLDFLSIEKLPQPNVLQLELDYVNHIEKGKGWERPADLPQVTTLLAANVSAFLPAPEATLLNSRYLIPERGRLHVTLQPAIRNFDKVELMQLTVSAHGRPAGSDIDSVLRWCDLGHEWTARGFVDVTTPRMHQLWGRTR